MSSDIVIVPDAEHAHLIEVWEPLPTKAPNPSIARNLIAVTTEQ